VVSEVRVVASQVNAYAPYAYDAVYAIAHALHYLIEVRGVSSVVGSELMDALIRNVSFAGVTGTVSLFDGSTNSDRQYHGDRRVGIACSYARF
jgi:ABC-type branched-subunit amino acid transport system substrate-binding protein